MSLFIKGMEMPENCDDCFLGDFYCEKCQHIDGYKMAGSRPFNCPLVEVPTPHGRLIDVDALERMDFSNWIVQGIVGYVPFMEVAAAIFKAPTVIEAEVTE